MPVDFGGNKVTKNSIGASGESLQQIVTSGIVLHLDAGNPNSYSGSGATWTNLIGTGNNATLVNSPTFSTEYNGTFAFNRSTTYVTLPNDTLTYNDFSVVMWVKGDGVGGGQTIFGNYPSGPLQLFYSTAYIGMWLNNSSAYANAGVYYTSNPVQFTATRKGTITSIYLNGTLIQEGSSSSSLGTGNPFRIGTNTSGTEPYGGKVYTCQAFRRALSLAEITQNFNATRDRYGV